MAKAFTIVRQQTVRFPGGYCGETFQTVTQLLVRVRNLRVDAWVRTWRRLSSIEHFMMSSGARLGNKARQDVGAGVEVLQLAATACWDDVARIVANADDLRRPVEAHPRWTVKTAQRVTWERRRVA